MTATDRAVDEPFFVSTNGGNVHDCVSLLNRHWIKPFRPYVLTIVEPGIIVWRLPRALADSLIHELGQTPLAMCK